MRVLQIHHRYSDQQPSGEDAVADAEAEALRHAGHDVATLSRAWDPLVAAGRLGLARAAISSIWNPGATAQVRKAMRLSAPDLVHVHNTFPTFSPAVFWSAHRHAPTVFTVHNYRPFCAAAVVSRQGRPCFDCLEAQSVVPALRYGCYRGSRLATAAPALMISMHQALGTWSRNIDAFIALSKFQRGVLARAGWPEARIHVKSNLIEDPGPPLPWAQRDPVAVFAGRLSPEKGGALLVKAWHEWGESSPMLRIVGSGPEELALRRMAQCGPAAGRIEFLGQLDRAAAMRCIRSAQLVIVPSVWDETFSLVTGEAMAAGTPSAVSRAGALPELVQDGRTGVHFDRGDSAALRAAVATLWNSGSMEAFGAAARRQYEQSLMPERVTGRLLEIYAAALEHHAAISRGS